jgi:transmembrane sensor
MPGDRLRYLLEKFHAGAASPEELAELENWYKELRLTDKLLTEESGSEKLKEDMLLQFRRRLAGQDKPAIPMRGRPWYRMAAAAAALLILSVTIFYITRTANPVPVVQHNLPDSAGDVLPGGNHATLTLANGTSILLDTAKRGGLAQQGISAIHKPVDGLLVYEKTDGANMETGMNTIRTPRGGQYQVQLPDGTKVWLNAASSIRFPVSFAVNQRKVTISGEVYFEVAHDVKIPFVVHVADRGEVEVLGTHFNINAYDDEVAVKTTLLEGKVKVSNINNQSKILSPGQQAQISNDQLAIINEADVEEAVAWKNGLFKFNDADLQTMLRQAARWYDIDVEIRGKDPGERFRGKISRDVKLSEFLRILEVNQVSFQIEGKKIIIQH